MEPGQLSASLFERNAQNLPAWLKPAELESEDFNATKYIAEVRRYVPLDLLAREFDSFTTYIKAQVRPKFFVLNRITSLLPHTYPLIPRRPHVSTSPHPYPLQLVDVINTNYSEYVSLSSRLTDVDVSVQRMKRPLLELKRRIEEARAAVQKEMETLHDQLEKRKGASYAAMQHHLLAFVMNDDGYCSA